mmetsp:Transcript_128030/g.368858  ORF Transcript_128030/g.368858 Transcript_128030/m.368858 type:complete len:97 (-) Transcript_128030:299-589(-)
MFQIQQGCFIARLVDKGSCDTSLSSPTGTTNAMDIIFNLTGHVEINDMLNIRKIQSLGCYIGRHKNILFPVLVQSNSFIAFFLIFTSMNTNCGNPL